MRSKIEKFLEEYNITTHSITAAIATLSVLYISVPSFHDLVVKIFNATPAWLHEVVTTALAIYAFYHKSNSGTNNDSKPPAA